MLASLTAPGHPCGMLLTLQICMQSLCCRQPSCICCTVLVRVFGPCMHTAPGMPFAASYHSSGWISILHSTFSISILTVLVDAGFQRLLLGLRCRWCRCWDCSAGSSFRLDLGHPPRRSQDGVHRVHQMIRPKLRWGLQSKLSSEAGHMLHATMQTCTATVAAFPACVTHSLSPLH
jgi:hypothetical protein